MESQIVTVNQAVTMTSLELVDYINIQRKEGEAELRHDNFMAKVPQVIGEKDGLNFKAIYKDSMNREKPCYRFPKREACLMAMSYSYDLQAKVYDKMTALEQQATKPALDPLNLSKLDILKLAIDAEEGRIKAVAELEQKQAQLAIAAPKAEALDRISTFSEGSMCVTNAAKALQLQPKKLFDWLKQHQWIYRRAGGSGWVGYQSRIQVGYVEHKITTVERTDGSSKQCEQVLITAKGLAKLATDFGSMIFA